MTGEEILRSVWARWNQGERRLDDDLIDPDFEVHSVLTGQAYRGQAGAHAWVSEIDDQFADWSISLDEVTEYAPDAFLCHGEIQATGRQSRVDLKQPAAWIVRLRDDRVLSLRNFIGQDSRAAAAREATPSA